MVLGIDLGTTYSVGAYVDNEGNPCVVSNLDGEDTTPSVVFFAKAGPAGRPRPALSHSFSRITENNRIFNSFTEHYSFHRCGSFSSAPILLTDAGHFLLCMD